MEFDSPYAGDFLTATATDPDNNTSEFSNCVAQPQDTVEFLSISPDASSGFPVVGADGTVTFSNLSVRYELTSDDSGTLFVRVFRDNNIDLVLGEASQPVTSAATVAQFASLVAQSVTEEISSVSVVAMLLPDSAADITAISLPLHYLREDSVEFLDLTPDPESPLTGGESVTVNATVRYRMTGGSQGRVELQIRHGDGQLLVDPPFEFVSEGLGTVDFEVSFDVPNDTNLLSVDALLVSGSGGETLTDPSVEYQIERIRIDSIDPRPVSP